jgi:RNA polymerase sigma-70 factor (ECF subfamily)
VADITRRWHLTILLWSCAPAGDPNAFGELFDRHGKAIYNYCFRRVGDWASAEDMLSIVLMRRLSFRAGDADR